MKQSRFLFLYVLLTLSSITGCNLFSFTNPINSSMDYLAEGQKKYWNGDFSGAVRDFARAKEQDPDNGEAYWWHAKALLRSTGYTAISLIISISDLDTQSGNLPFMGWSADSANKLYRALFEVDTDLKLIYEHSVHSSELDSDAVSLDYAASLAVFGVLMLRDTNVDSVINEEDINFGAYFENNSLVIPRIEWDKLTNEGKNELINSVQRILENFSVVFGRLAANIEGIDIEAVNEVVSLISDGLENLRPGVMKYEKYICYDLSIGATR